MLCLSQAEGSEPPALFPSEPQCPEETSLRLSRWVLASQSTFYPLGLWLCVFPHNHFHRWEGGSQLNSQ